ncbi:MAG: tyrosine-type recombinase/integrase [Streptosporangiaceae bacterium]
MSERCRVRVAGPLLPYVEGFWEELVERGYAPGSARVQVGLLAHLSRWLAAEGLAAGELTDVVVERFVRARQREGYVTLVSRRSPVLLLGYLRGCGVVPPVAPVKVGPVDALLAEYRCYLTGERGLAAGTVVYYLDAADLFLAECSDRLRVELECLSAGQVTTFVLRECRERSVESSKTLVCGLRSLLRFLFVKGFIPLALADAVPTVARRRQSLPRGLDSQTVAGLLSSCDRRTTVGRRDYAILLLLVRLGLRGGEVAALQLGDVDWRAGELSICAGKGRRVDRLPLSDDVGQALAGYLQRGRPRCEDRALFLRVHAPRAGLSANGVKQVVRHACVRAGVPECGSHRLRHTAATEMLRAGAPLTEIAQLLRHRSVATTAIYAQVDRVALAALAKPWPGGAA